MWNLRQYGDVAAVYDILVVMDNIAQPEQMPRVFEATRQALRSVDINGTDPGALIDGRRLHGNGGDF